MYTKSQLLEDAIAATAFLGFAAFAPLYTFSLEPVRKQVLVAPAVAASPQLLLPLKCDARVRQSDGKELPRARLLYAAEMPDARCYIAKGRT
jgi:hypothetical protein